MRHLSQYCYLNNFNLASFLSLRCYSYFVYVLQRNLRFWIKLTLPDYGQLIKSTYYNKLSEINT